MRARRFGKGSGAGAALAVLLALAAVAHGATGDISAERCVSGNSDTGPGLGGSDACDLLPLATPGGTDGGQDAPQSVDVSPDGKSVYITSQLDDAIAHFQRDPATGVLSYGECITGEMESGPSPDGNGTCGGGPPVTSHGFDSGMDGLVDAVVSPDGADVFAVSGDDDAVVHFSRDQTDGSLLFRDCLSADSGATVSDEPCEATSTVETSGTNSGLDSPSGIAITPTTDPAKDTIYVTSQLDDSVAAFVWNKDTSDLSFAACVTGEAATGSAGTADCFNAPTVTANGTNSGLDMPFAPTISGDGTSLYVSSNNDASIAWFNRNPIGPLTWNDCITGEVDTGPAPNGNGACSTLTPTAPLSGSGGTGANSGMERTQAVAISPDDASVYTASQNDAAVVNFDRDATNGDLTFAQCLSADGQSSGCAQVPPATTFGVDSGLNFAQALAISPDGKSLYVAGAGDDAITTFTRDIDDGTIQWSSCLTGEQQSGPAPGGTGACEPTASPETNGTLSGMDGLRSLAVPSDGLSLLGAAEGDDAIPLIARSYAPETTIDDAPPALTKDPTATFDFSADEDNVLFECRIDLDPFGDCSGTGTHTTGTLPDGQHTFRVRALNEVDSKDPTPAQKVFTVDATAPGSSISSGPSGPSTSRSAQFAFTGSGSPTGFECRLDSGTFTSCTSPKSYSGLSDGEHAFEVRSRDAAGNRDASPASREFSVDTKPPKTTIDAKPKKKVRTNKKKSKAKFKFSSSEPGSSFECMSDKGKDWKTCDSPFKKKYKRGKHVFKVRATDRVGNVDGSPASWKWKIKRKK
jgi:hypothetical protein